MEEPLMTIMGSEYTFDQNYGVVCELYGDKLLITKFPNIFAHDEIAAQLARQRQGEALFKVVVEIPFGEITDLHVTPPRQQEGQVLRPTIKFARRGFLKDSPEVSFEIKQWEQIQAFERLIKQARAAFESAPQAPIRKAPSIINKLRGATMPTYVCPFCGEPVNRGASVCPQCRHSLASEAVCARCGQPLAPDTSFCKQCGAPVGSQASANTPRICPQCGAEATPDQNFCGKCGARVGSQTSANTPQICPQCGAEATPDQSFCGKCGARLAQG